MKTQLTFAIYRKRIALLNLQPIFGIENWEGLFFWSFGSNRSKGVGIWIRSGLNLQIISTDKDSEGRLLFILIKINNVTIRLANIYAPVIPSERRLFFNSLHHYLVGNCPVILGGDFNCVQNINLDKRRG